MIRRVSSTTVRPTSSTDAGPAQPRRRGLEDAELGGAGLGLLEQLGVGQRDRGVRGEGRDEGDVAVGPGARLERDRRERADDAVVVDERRDEVAGELEHAVVAVDSRACASPRTSSRATDAAGAQDLADPALVAAEDRQASRRRRRSMPAQAATSRRSSRRIRIVVLSARSARIVSSTMVRNSSCAIVRRGEPLGDARGRSPAARRARPRGGGATLVGVDRLRGERLPRRGAAARGTATVRRPGSRMAADPGTPGSRSSLLLTHAHVPMVAPPGRSTRPASGPEPARTDVPGARRHRAR